MRDSLKSWIIYNSPFKSELADLFNYYARTSDKVSGLLFTETISTLKKIREETDLLLTDIEAYQLWMAVINTAKIPGHIAEVGVYQGGSAKIICEARRENGKKVFLFDTFEGLPGLTKKDDHNTFKKGSFQTPFESVKALLAPYRDVVLTKGYFPDSGTEILNEHFSFANLDVDLYESTKKSLEFFYPRMTNGGIIMSHDYGLKNSVGVKTAFDEFFKDKPETVVPLMDSHCIIVKSL